MNFLKFVLALNVWYLGLALAEHVGINDPFCSQDDTELYANGNLETMFNRMLTSFNETCTPDQCNLKPAAPLEGFLNWDYGGVNFAMRRACEVRRNYKACTVKTTVRHNFELEGIELYGYVIENEKGVCFPPSCSDEDISILEPNPGQCDPATMDCEVVSYEVDCPSRTVNANANCASDQLPPTNPFFISRGTRELAIMGDCATLFSGTGISLGLCTASTGDVHASFNTNFQGFETDSSYVRYKDMCSFQFGQLCLFDMNADYTVSGSLLEPAIDEIIPIEKAGDIILTNEFIQFPRCIAQSCKEEDMEEVLAHHATKFFLDQFGFECNLDSPDCNIKISNVNCMTTSAPTIALTLFPTPDPTQALSTKPSENSSSHPTSTPFSSFVPTETSTLLPTLNPRAKKTFMPTSTPTVEPTLNPRPKKTLLPSNISSVKPTSNPTVVSSETPTESSSMQPSSNPRPKKTQMPSSTPTVEPTLNPRPKKTQLPSNISSVKPTSNPTVVSSETPTESSIPSLVISHNPTETASLRPTTQPSESISTMPTSNADPRQISSLSPTEASSSTTTEPTVTTSSSAFTLSYRNIIIPVVTFWILKWELM